MGDAPHLFHHAAAVLHAPAYAEENAGALRQDWPRVPLPADGEHAPGLAALGRQVAALLDTETAVHGVTAGNLRPELKVIGVVARVGGGSLNRRRRAGRDGALGRGGKGGVCMPGKGRLTRPATTRRTKPAALGGGGR